MKKTIISLLAISVMALGGCEKISWQNGKRVSIKKTIKKLNDGYWKYSHWEGDSTNNFNSNYAFLYQRTFSLSSANSWFYIDDATDPGTVRQLVGATWYIDKTLTASPFVIKTLNQVYWFPIYEIIGEETLILGSDGALGTNGFKMIFEKEIR